MLVKKMIGAIQKRTFPSEHQLMVKKWFSDGGDQAFRFDYDLNENSIVIDLGGYQGQWASDLFGRYQCRIFIFEPVTTFADQIDIRFRNNNKINVYPYGLGGDSRSEEVYLAADGTSLFGDAGNKEKIQIIDVKDWLNENIAGQANIDLIKINIEGGEYELLDRLIETGLIAAIENIQVQFHDVSPTSLAHMNAIQTELHKTHEPTYQYKFVWENWKRRPEK